MDQGAISPICVNFYLYEKTHFCTNTHTHTHTCCNLSHLAQFMRTALVGRDAGVGVSLCSTCNNAEFQSCGCVSVVVYLVSKHSGSKSHSCSSPAGYWPRTGGLTSSVCPAWLWVKPTSETLWLCLSSKSSYDEINGGQRQVYCVY